MQPLMIVYRGLFWLLLKYLRLGLKDGDIPHQAKMREIVIEHANTIKALLREKFKVYLIASMHLLISFISVVLDPSVKDEYVKEH